MVPKLQQSQTIHPQKHTVLDTEVRVHNTAGWDGNSDRLNRAFGHKIGTYVMTQRDIQYIGDGGCKHRGFEMKMGDH